MNFLTLDLNLLRVFDAVMIEQNLTRAADKLAMTQPAVSNALKRLRHAFNDELLIRTAYGVKPTPRAESVWPQKQRLLSGWPWRMQQPLTGCPIWYAVLNKVHPVLMPA